MSFDGPLPALPGHPPKVIGPGPGFIPPAADPDRPRRAVPLTCRVDGGCR